MESSVLIIDDDVELCALMKKCISQERFSADIAYTGKEGLSKLTERNNVYCLVILDVILSDIDGFQILSEIRKDSAVPVLMLTAKAIWY